MTENELIAEFMEIPKLSDSKGIMWDYHKTGQEIYCLRSQDLHYDESWNWLMPVVEKIKEDYDVSIRFYAGDCSCYINKQSIEGVEICSYGNFEPSITNVYKAVVNFIKWYNKNKS